MATRSAEKKGLDALKQPSVKDALVILGIVAAYFFIVLLPTPEGLTPSGQKAIALMVCVVLTWATQVVPILVGSVFFIFAAGLLGLETLPDAAGAVAQINQLQVIKDFATPTVFFMFVSILLAYAMDKCGLNQRLALAMTAMSKGNPKAIIWFFTAGTALISTIISNVPSCAAFFPIVLAVIKKNNCEKGKSNFAKASIIAIIFGAMVGGNATPAGTPINIMALDLLEAAGFERLTFAEWSVMGIPLVLVIVPVICLILTFVFPPEFKKLAGVEEAKADLKALGRLNPQEIKFIIMSAVMLVVWFLEGYAHNMSTTTVLTIYATMLFFPGIRLLDYEYVQDKLDWTVIIMTGASIAFGAAMLKTGAAGWIADIFLAPFTGVGSTYMGQLLLVTVLAAFTCVVHLLIPSCPALVGVLVPVVLAFGQNHNIPVMLLFLPVAFNVSTYWLLPFDPLPMMCYPEKYFSIRDFFKAGWIAHAALIIVSVAVVMLIGRPMFA